MAQKLRNKLKDYQSDRVKFQPDKVNLKFKIKKNNKYNHFYKANYYFNQDLSQSHRTYEERTLNQMGC